MCRRGDINLRASVKESCKPQILIPADESKGRTVSANMTPEHQLKGVLMRVEDFAADMVYIRGRLVKNLEARHVSMDDCLMEGSTPYRAYNRVLQDLRNALIGHLPEEPPDLEITTYLFGLLQKDFVHRGQFMEAIHLQY